MCNNAQGYVVFGCKDEQIHTGRLIQEMEFSHIDDHKSDPNLARNQQKFTHLLSKTDFGQVSVSLCAPVCMCVHDRLCPAKFP